MANCLRALGVPEAATIAAAVLALLPVWLPSLSPPCKKCDPLARLDDFVGPVIVRI
jgi:hypothetical protein